MPSGRDLRWTAANLSAPPTVSRLGLGAVLALVIGGFAWLVFGVGEPRAGMHRLWETAGARVEAIADASPRLTRDEIAALPDTAWQTWTARGYLSARHGDVIWLRVRLSNPGPEPLQGVLENISYFSDRNEAWQTDSAGRWQHKASGDAVAGGVKPLWGRTAAFPVTVPAGGERLLYLRVSDGFLAHVQPVWWPRAEDFHAAQIQAGLAECLCYGALLALVFYNTVLWVRLRFADTGYYVLAAAASAACNFIANGGLALLGLRSGSPLHEALMAGAFALGGIGMVQFARVFLGTAELLPRVDRGLRAWRWVLLGVALGVLAMPGMTTPLWLSVSVLAAMVTEAVCMMTAIAAWRAGATHARFFVAAFGLLLVPAVLAVVSVARSNVLPGTALSLLAGRVVEMLLLSFAVADRFAQAQRRLAEETEQRRLVEETYADELEIEVRERTRELAEANTDKDRMLTVIGHDLRSPLTGLMRSADETAGDFARETARTGRAILLMIEDLVLWARLRAGTRESVALSADALTGPAVALHRSLAEHAGIRLVVTAPEALRIETDLVLAQTLVRNLLANALKFADTRVTLRAEATREGVRFSVGNDGPPLEPELAARFAAGEDGPMTATGGLGLRLCREICRALDTRLAAGTAADGGTEFYFTLKPAASVETPNP